MNSNEEQSNSEVTNLETEISPEKKKKDNYINELSGDKKLDEESIRTLSLYWEQVRQNYHAFETDFKGGSSDVYLHQMPGGQFTNLKEQARSLGITTDKWGMVANK